MALDEIMRADAAVNAVRRGNDERITDALLGKPETRLTTAQVIAALNNLQAIVGRIIESQGQVMECGPQRLPDVLRMIKENAGAAVKVVDRLLEANK